ncbi:MAG TPA: penicillin-binding transpeptidase domain-containing protein [Phycisphaerae bacterium]|nr:penicillin-binding transpeptidase domain-containing protein [Phycisphaerae bacterium]HRR85006.1 penicillin-binding transpeptidase domain-containing protein [Phycisphaerae bacterium]
MFERRLRLIMVLMVMPVIAVTARLVQLQILEGEEYASKAEALLIKPMRLYPCLRGEIVDSEGVRLAYDAESWDICVHYGILSEAEDHLRAMARERLGRRGIPRTADNVAEEMHKLGIEINESWHAIARLTGRQVEELDAVRERRLRQVQRIKEVVTRRRKIDTVVDEERTVHPIVQGLNHQMCVEAKVQLAEYPWVEVLVSHTRRYEGGDAMGHLYGMLNEVGPDDLRENSNNADILSRYLLGDLIGRTGLERLGEQWLRGRRGCEQEDLRGVPTTQPVAPVDGNTMRLSLNLRLQQYCYHRLQAAVREHPPSTGGAAVILDVPTRRVLALVSYPAFDPNLPDTERAKLAAQDPFGQPHVFRAVHQPYPPGSTIKAMVLPSALTEGKVGPGTTYDCVGHLFPGLPNKWQCDARRAHGTVDPVLAVQKSCNVFFYHVGENMGLANLVKWMDRFGFGRVTGIGLIEDATGTLPQLRRDMGAGPARLAAIGQGEVSATPLQLANMMATVASGVWKPVTIWPDNPDQSLQGYALPIPAANWRLVREGLYKVVNEQGGTAYGPLRAKLAGEEEFVLLGKTGSAEAPALERLYRCRFPDGTEKTIKARTFRELRNRYPEGQKPEYISQEDAQVYPTHGWFVGYLTTRGHYLEPAIDGELNVAIAVIVEYAGHGGAVAAPVARDMLQAMITLHRGGTIETAPADDSTVRSAAAVTDAAGEGERP